MRNSRRIICMVSIFFLLTGFLVFPVLEKDRSTKKDIFPEPIGLEIIKEKKSQRIMLYEGQEEDTFYAFLPSYTEFDNIYLAAEKDLKVRINDSSRLLVNGDRIANLMPDQLNQAAVYDPADEKSRTILIKCLVSSGLPTVSITTRSGTMDMVHSEKGAGESGYLEVISEEGKNLYAGRLNKFYGRGNTSFEAPKKSYVLKLDSALSLLGMEASTGWILNANYYDGTMIRNKIGFEIAARSGLEYTPDSCFADLYIDGIYYGLYQLTERIEAGPGRVDIGNGYLYEIDYPERAIYEENVLYLDNGQPIVVHNPEKISESQLSLLEEWFGEMLGALNAEDYVSPETGKGIFEYLDRDSFAGMYLMEEILEDLDFGRTSHYFYMESAENRLLYDGPVWDLDNTLGRGYGRNHEERNALFAPAHSLSTNIVSRMYARLCGNEEFQEEVFQRWEENVYPALVSISREIDGLILSLSASMQMDGLRWPGEHSIFMPQAERSENVKYLKDYLEERTNYLYSAYTENTDQTLAIMKRQAAGLPELNPVDTSAIPVSGKEETAQGKGIRNVIIGSHGILSFAVLLVLLAVFAVLDRKWNGRWGEKQPQV